MVYEREVKTITELKSKVKAFEILTGTRPKIELRNVNQTAMDMSQKTIVESKTNEMIFLWDYRIVSTVRNKTLQVEGIDGGSLSCEIPHGCMIRLSEK